LFYAEADRQRSATNGHAIPAAEWRSRLMRLEGIYRELIRSPEWELVGNEEADGLRLQLQFTRGQTLLAERRDSA
jgi:predicted ABC-type ATPase